MATGGMTQRQWHAGIVLLGFVTNNMYAHLSDADKVRAAYRLADLMILYANEALD